MSGVLTDSRKLKVYRPVDWLIDNTPVRKPLLWWADVCGVGDEFFYAANSRDDLRPVSGVRVSP
jgi:hypothetical protein